MMFCEFGSLKCQWQGAEASFFVMVIFSAAGSAANFLNAKSRFTIHETGFMNCQIG
jgi:hypothetical protein